MLAHYAQNGFLISESPLISQDVVEDAVVGVENLLSGTYDTGTPLPKSRWQPGDDPTTLRKINLPHIASTHIRRLIDQKELGAFAHAVTGADNVQVWWTQLVYKPPEQEDFNPQNEVTVHQDSTYEQDWSEDSNLFTLWIALSDITEDSGPLQYLQGSHRLGAQHKDIPYFERLTQTLENNNPYLNPQFKEIKALMKKGQVSCHHRHIYHGGGANTSTKPRIGIALHLCADGARVLNKSAYTENLDNPDICPMLYGQADQAKVWEI